jgi:hypothetical protein
MNGRNIAIAIFFWAAYSVGRRPGPTASGKCGFDFEVPGDVNPERSACKYG